MTFGVRLHVEVGQDLERIEEHLRRFEVEDRAGRLRGILTALRVLERSPWIGRPSGLFREIVIGEDATAYVARYRVDDVARIVEVLAIRHAREDGYRR